MICPCINCVGLALCRHKPYNKLFNDCSIIEDHIPDHQAMELRDEDKINLLQSILHPTRWSYDGFYIDGSYNRSSHY